MNEGFAFAASVLSNIKQQNTSIIMDRESLCSNYESNGEDYHSYVDPRHRRVLISVKSEGDRTWIIHHHMV
jgi:hypothetical protein